MKALFLACQDKVSHGWSPIARLTKQDGQYHFLYTKGVHKIPGFVPLGRMVDIGKEYISDDLFPLFSNRILPKSRPEYSEYLNWLGLSYESHSAIEELARTGGLRATDNLELIPCPEPTPDKRYEAYFFCRGLSHFHKESQDRASTLAEGARLFLLRDICNEFDEAALLLRTGDPISLVGYVPKYYSAEFTRLLSAASPDDAKVTVERVNASAPLQYRVLCKFSAPWPDGFSAYSGEDFMPVVG